MNQYEVYTDGSYKGRWGSWAYVILQKGSVLREDAARAKKTNSNRMEFQAAIESLKSLPIGATVKMFTDSRILIENIPQFAQWSQNQWRKQNDRAVPNADLFKQLYELLQERNVTWQWVKAHSGHPQNERCDQLCIQVREGVYSAP